MTADFPDFMPVAQQELAAYAGVSTQIAALIATGQAAGIPGGVPLRALPVELYNTSATIVAFGILSIPNTAAGTITDVRPFLSYELLASQQAQNTTVKPFATYRLHWYADAGGTQELYRETWCTIMDDAAGTSVVGTGPVRGAYLTVTATNEDGVNSYNLLDFVMLGHSRAAPMLQPDFRDFPITAAVPGYTVGIGGENVDGILGYFNALTIPALGTITLRFGLYNGQAIVNVILTAGAAPNLQATQVGFIPGVGVVALGDVLVFAALGSYSFNANPPRGPLLVQLHNASAANPVTVNLNSLVITQF